MRGGGVREWVGLRGRRMSVNNTERVEQCELTAELLLLVAAVATVVVPVALIDIVHAALVGTLKLIRAAGRVRCNKKNR